jgi:serine/threonine protein kinase
MERLAGDYSMLSAALFQSEEGAQIKTAVENVMQTLHKAGFVHGDFRYENIMYRFEQLEDSGSSSVDIKLLDFDFSGVAGQAVYPIALSNRISWHPTAGISQILKPEHDQHFFNQFGQSLLSKRHSPASSAIFLAPQSKGTTVETSTCRVVDIFAQTILPFPFEQQ